VFWPAAFDAELAIMPGRACHLSASAIALVGGAHSRDPVGITPITVATIAVIAVSAKDLARWLSGTGETAWVV
jgi:hypothetical protein